MNEDDNKPVRLVVNNSNEISDLHWKSVFRSVKWLRR
jgi:hypothetical protein